MSILSHMLAIARNIFILFSVVFMLALASCGGGTQPSPTAPPTAVSTPRPGRHQRLSKVFHLRAYPLLLHLPLAWKVSILIRRCTEQALTLISSRLVPKLVAIQSRTPTPIRPVWNSNLNTEYPYSHLLIWYL